MQPLEPGKNPFAHSLANPFMEPDLSRLNLESPGVKEVLHWLIAASS